MSAAFETVVSELASRVEGRVEQVRAGGGPERCVIGPAGHRAVMAAVRAEVVLALVRARAEGIGVGGGGEGVERAARWFTRVEDLQTASGLFASGDNLASPPDTSFTLQDMCSTLALLRQAGPAWPDDLGGRLERVLERALPAVRSGGVHTPNHRWEVASALVRAGALLGDPSALARAREWLAEGIDVDTQGVYSERSPNYAAHVSNPALLALADGLDRPELRRVVHRSLHTMLDLATPAGQTETVMSRRQDQKELGFPLTPLAWQLATFARECPRCAAACAWTLRLPETAHELALDSLTAVMLDARVARGFERSVAGAPRSLRELREAALGRGSVEITSCRLARRWSPEGWTVVYAGSDVPAAGRIASGLACNPTFVRLTRGSVQVASLRLARDFFGLGPFRATSLEESGGGFVLRERVGAAYYQPLPASARRPDGSYPLEHEGRFAAAMAFSGRVADRLELATRVTVRELPRRLELEVLTEGPPTAHALEIALGEGTAVVAGPRDGAGDEAVGGARAAGAAHRLIERAELEGANGDRVYVTAEPGGDPGLRAAYTPGEAYTYLGGTDALGGERIYLAWSSPGLQRLTFAW